MVEALLAGLEMEDHPAVRLTVVMVPVLAGEEAGDVEDLLPCLRGYGQVVAQGRLERGLVGGVVQDIAAIVEHLPVGVVQHAVADIVPAVELPQRRRHGIVAPARELAARQQRVHRGHMVAGDQVAVEERCDHGGVVAAATLAEIEHQVGIELADRDQAELEVGASELFPDGTQRLDRARDRSMRTLAVREQPNRRPGEGRRGSAEQRPQLVDGSLDHRVLVGRTELEQDRPIGETLDMLSGSCSPRPAREQQSGSDGRPSLRHVVASPYATVWPNQGVPYRRL